MPHLFTDKTRAKELLRVTHKPQTAITSWVDRICEPPQTFIEADLNQFIVELVEVINLQSTGPEEASRAIRKQLKHGHTSQQKKALSLLESLVLNGGIQFQTTFADDRMVDCIKMIVYDPRTDSSIRIQTMLMLLHWSKTFKSDPKMTTVAGLYNICGGNQNLNKIQSSSTKLKNNSKINQGSSSNEMIDLMIKGMEKDLTKLKTDIKPIKTDSIKSGEKVDKDQRRKKKKNKSPIDQRFRTHLPDEFKPSNKFKLEKEVPQILKLVATAAQCANNLVNCLQLMDHAKEDVHSDTKVQTNVERTKLVQKSLIRYIQSVAEQDVNGEYIGTLLNTNAQVVAALELYELLADPSKTTAEIDATAERIKNLSNQSKPTMITQERGVFDDPLIPLSNDLPSSSINHHHHHQEDLLGIDFNQDELNQLPKPISPNKFINSKNLDDFDPGHLSDFSEFDGSEIENDPLKVEESKNDLSSSFVTHQKIPTSSNSKNKDSEEENSNPFEDPFF
ncbi:hypothetical protein CROQUDRAFT_663109 [Cronartium quercuum f. sp. fusiforme G11]|uniref:VHS domain-containing protein n=1 Tax=Cronartium quercuum f. sp. fusiforme G11 TaxID=708437 RepID=A0A9P6T7G6_9BASI|nr:hypothetical protein CROQUDRAFT_663109 [Cronartium quercuum f. sp. fusiforme G11]